MKIIFFGTGGSLPTKDRGLISIGLRLNGEFLLFDCGECTQRQMTHTNFSPMNVDAIFLTHFHGDHFSGLPGLVQTMSLMDRERPLDIYGPPDVEERITSMLRVPIYTLKFEIRVREIKAGRKVDRGGYEVTTTESDHSVPGLAYALVEGERPGKFHPDRARELGLEPGPKYSQLQKGESVETESGDVVNPEQVIGPPRPGRKITYTGDTRPAENIVKLAKNSDILIHDATFGKDLEDEAEKAGHSTVEDAAIIANRADVDKLVLVHPSPRYPDLSDLERQARDIFTDTIFAEDLMEIEVEFKDHRGAQKKS